MHGQGSVGMAMLAARSDNMAPPTHACPSRHSLAESFRTPASPAFPLAQPPDESYSLHRKLSGAFLSCMKLRARVPCQALFNEAYATHQQLAQQDAQHTAEVLSQQRHEGEERLAA